MKPGTDNNEPFPLPPALLAQVRAAAEEEHRPTREIVREAVERYLENRRPPDASPNGPTEKALAAVAQIRELRKGNILPEGVTIQDLINEGRA